MSQLIHNAQDYSLYVTTYTLRSRLQFICHNLYTTLKITVYMSQLIHYTQDYSLYVTTYTLRSRLHLHSESLQRHHLVNIKQSSQGV
jgi:hypothetical protein